MPKTTQIGAKPVDSGMLGNTPAPAPALGWGSTPAGGGGGIGWGSSPGGAGGIGGGTGGLQGLLGDLRGGLGGGAIPQPWVDMYNRQTPGTQAAMSSRWSGMSPDAITNDWNTNIQPRYSPGTTPDQILGGAPTLGGGGMGSLDPSGPGMGGAGMSGAPAAPARAGFKLGNRGAQKRISGGNPYGALRTAATDGGPASAPGLFGDPAPGSGAGPEPANWMPRSGGSAAPASPGGTSSGPGPAGGGLQSLLTRARAMSPYGQG